MKDGISCVYVLAPGARFKSPEAGPTSASFQCAGLPFLEHTIEVLLTLFLVSLQARPKSGPHVSMISQ